MGAEKYNYQQYEGLPKEERRKRIAEIAPETLETKRFFLSRNPELKKRVQELHKVVDALKEKYPEIISLNIFGSLIKGYANEQSDLDAFVFIDKSKIPKNTFHDLFYYDILMRDAIKQNTNLQDSQVAHCIAQTITVEDVVASARHKGYAGVSLFELFLISIGRDIHRYRKAAIDTLEKMGPEGEMVWQRIMEELWYFENKGLPDELKEKRKKLYPQTIAEGRKYFLQGNK